MNYAVQTRLRMIDFLLAQYGYVNRSAIMTYFGIGPATATRDFKLYMKMTPLNAVYNSTEKAYYATQCFVRYY